MIKYTRPIPEMSQQPDCLRLCTQFLSFVDRTNLDTILCSEKCGKSTRIKTWSGVIANNIEGVKYSNGFYTIPQTGTYAINVNLTVNNVITMNYPMVDNGCCDQAVPSVIVQLFSTGRRGDFFPCQEGEDPDQCVPMILAKSATPITFLNIFGVPNQTIAATLAVPRVKLCRGQKIAIAISQNSGKVGTVPSGGTLSVVRIC